MLSRRLFALLPLCLNTQAWAAGTISVDGARIFLKDIAPHIDGPVREVDLGPSPPPGGTRTFAARDVRNSVIAAGFDGAALKLPSLVRVRAAARRLSPTDLVDLGTPAILSALPTGVTLIEVKARTSVWVSPSAVATRVKIPKLPKRVGALKTTAMVEFARRGQSGRRVPLSVTVNISDAAAQPDIKKGRTLKLVIERGSAIISAHGTAVVDCDVGDVARFRVKKTGRILRARVISSRVAKVVEGP